MIDLAGLALRLSANERSDIMRSMFESATSRQGADQAPHVVMPWLVRLRWVSVIALAAASWAAYTFWRVRLPVGWVVALLSALAVTNAALAFQLRSPAPRRVVVGAVLVVDVGLLTGLLYLVGGPINPVSIVYLVGITVAAVSLGHRWAIALGVLSNLAYGFTFFYHRPLEFIDESFSSRVLTLHLAGMWVAFAAATGLIAYFAGRVSEALTERERELTAARAAAAKSDRVAALFALGAGAAHELATPLSTIATATGELERTMTHRPQGIATAESEYIRMIRGEVERCTTVLDQLSGRAAAASAAESQVLLARLVDDLRYRLGDSLAQRLDVSLPPVSQPIDVPGFQASTMVQYYSSLPFNIVSGVNSLQGTGGRPFADGAVSAPNFDVRSVEFIPRNEGKGSDFFTVNLRVSRVFQLRGGSRIEGLVEAFNLTNHVNAITRNTTFGTGSYPSNPLPSFNTVTAVGDPRTLQFGIRASF